MLPTVFIYSHFPIFYNNSVVLSFLFLLRTFHYLVSLLIFQLLWHILYINCLDANITII